MKMNFSIFKNENKKSEKQPDYTVSMKINDEYKKVGGGWIKESKKGKYISVSIDTEYNNEQQKYSDVPF